ncbi:hypothetical protein BaRGS_00040373 [Batillaria attramentaria]|uniref:Uncharacterized protein n=1 Tax=Batillaria attramentaria TaxID=370345 RepID=A0ABD0J0D0_9CAEN
MRERERATMTNLPERARAWGRYLDDRIGVGEWTAREAGQRNVMHGATTAVETMYHSRKYSHTRTAETSDP